MIEPKVFRGLKRGTRVKLSNMVSLDDTDELYKIRPEHQEKILIGTIVKNGFSIAFVKFDDGYEMVLSNKSLELVS